MDGEIVSRFWDPVAQHLTHSIKLEENVRALRKAMKKLLETGKEVKRKVAVAERKGLIPRSEVTGWLGRVESIEVEVNQIEAAFDQRRMFLKYFSWSNYLLGKRAANMLAGVVELQNEGVFSNVAPCQVRKIKLECLGWNEAWDLFREKVGEDAMNSHPEIPNLAMTVAEECGGLPVALITIGRAMASKKKPEEWKYAIKVLRKLACDFPVIEDKLFPLLKFSYDNLFDDTMRSCFLYCSLYPEGCPILKAELIEFWMGEGFLDEYDDLDEARNKGYDLISRLKVACLLEDGEDEETEVKLLHIIRELALWIASEGGENKNKFLVRARVGLTKAPILEKWQEATRISLMKNKLKALKNTPTCPNLLTLMLQENEDLNKISNSFFQFMPLLKVLDLSFTQIKKLPTGIRKLVKLRHLNLAGTPLEELPIEIGELVELQHLDLSFTTIEELPLQICKLVELQYLNLDATEIETLPGELVSLEKLKHLDLGMTESLETIPHNVITGLSKLQVLNLYRSKYKYWKVEGSVHDESWVDVGELEGLKHLNDLGLTISNFHALSKVIGSQVFTKCTQHLAISDCNELTWFQLSSPFENMKRLRNLYIGDCCELKVLTINDEVEGENRLLPSLENLFLWNLDKLKTTLVPHVSLQNLRVININGCQELKNVTWVLHLRSLQEIRLMHCYGMEEVIGDEVEAVAQDLIAFSRLERIILMYLPELKIICRRALAFPSLHFLTVNYCPELEKLPFSHDSTNKDLLKINGTKRWWDGLEWEDESIKATFLPFFKDNEDWD